MCLGPRSPFDNGLACVPNADIQAAERKRTGRMAAAATCNTRPQGGPQLSRRLWDAPPSTSRPAAHRALRNRQMPCSSRCPCPEEEQRCAPPSPTHTAREQSRVIIHLREGSSRPAEGLPGLGTQSWGEEGKGGSNYSSFTKMLDCLSQVSQEPRKGNPTHQLPVTGTGSFTARSSHPAQQEPVSCLGASEQASSCRPLQRGPVSPPPQKTTCTRSLHTADFAALFPQRAPQAGWHLFPVCGP